MRPGKKISSELRACFQLCTPASSIRRCGAGVRGLAGLGGALAGALVFDVGDGQPDQLDHGVIDLAKHRHYHR
jgi:hypothetical protein